MRTGVQTKLAFVGQTSILILIYIFMAMGIVFTGYLYYLNYEHNFRVNMERQLTSVAQLKVEQLFQWRKERLGDGGTLLRNPAFSSLVRRFLEKPGDVGAQKQLQAWLGKFHEEYQYVRVALFDTEGAQRISVPEAPEMVDPFTAQSIAPILREGRALFQDFHRDTTDGLIHLGIQVPIFDEVDESRPLGVIVMDINPETYLYPFIAKWPVPGQTTETLLVRRDGDDVLFLNEVKYHKNAPLNLRVPLTKTDVPSVQGLLGYTGIVDGVGYDGQPVVGAVVAVRDTPWYLVSKINSSEIYAPLRERLWLMLTIVGLLLAGSGMAIGFIWKHRSARFYKEQQEAAEALRNAEGSLQKSERKYRQLTEQASEGIFTVDQKSRYLDANPAGLQMLGYTIEELMDILLTDLIAPDELKKTPSKLPEILSGRAVATERMLHRKDGSFFQAEITSKLMTDGNILVTKRDITERKKAEEALQKSEERWRFALEGAGDGVWDWNIQTGEALYSRRYKEMLGFTDSEIGNTASEWSNRVHPEDMPGAMEIIQAHLDGKTPTAVIEFRMLRKDGNWQWTLCRGMVVQRDADGKPLRLVGANTDITERRAVEEITPDIFYGIDLHGSLQRWNHSLKAFCGLSTERMKGRACLDFVCEEDRPIVARDIQKVLTDGSASNIYRFTRSDGVLVPFHCNGTLILNSRGEPSGFAGFGRDISELQEKERRLRDAKEQAEAATKLKDKFVEMVAHDLKSPFISMVGLLKLLVERIPPFEDAENQNILDRIFKSGDRMIATIDDLLKVSRFQTGQITPQLRFFKGRMAVSATIGSLGYNATQKGIEIINDVPADTRLYADLSLFEEVLLNLLSNAIKFCSRGDRITFFIPPGLKSAIAVRDTGTGISERNVLNLFKHEVKTSSIGTAGEIGTGFGLPFSHNIMKAHGGKITVESALGKGSLFCAALPDVKPVALIVDDDDLALEILREHLENIGVDVVTASNGDRALEALKNKRSHLVITDVNMPVMGGFALLSSLKKDSATREIPVIVITASDREAREKALMLGADDFVGKPVAMDEFIPRVRKFIA